LLYRKPSIKAGTGAEVLSLIDRNSSLTSMAPADLKPKPSSRLSTPAGHSETPTWTRPEVEHIIDDHGRVARKSGGFFNRIAPLFLLLSSSVPVVGPFLFHSMNLISP
jgi:hypothetical protein